MLAAALHDAAQRGLIPATDIDWLVDLGARRRPGPSPASSAGKRAERAMKDYQQAADRARLPAPPLPARHRTADFVERGQGYVERIDAVRPYVAFPGQVVPQR